MSSKETARQRGAGMAHLCTSSCTKSDRQHGKPAAKLQRALLTTEGWWQNSKPHLCHCCTARTRDIFLYKRDSGGGKIGSILLTFMTGLQSTCVYGRRVASNRRLLLLQMLA